MDVSLVAVSANRKFTRLFIRFAQSLELLRQIRVLGSDGQTLQLVFVDQPEDHVRAIASKDDKILQVEVGIPQNATLLHEADFLTMVALRLVRAGQAAGLNSTTLSQLRHHVEKLTDLGRS